ncbi:MAG: MoxR family ATPase [Planctomycetes bacterium]|nr:MoxR family ATPase [Planctomycetota bacterium]MCP4839673.1 MoxR family ATPase [Planctomycetota bacterium]
MPPPEGDPADAASVVAAVAAVRAGIAALRQEIAGAVHGQEDVVDAVLGCLMADGHALLEGVPGTGKTLLVRTVAAATGLDVGRVQFTPDLMPADISGTTVMAEGHGGVRSTIFRRGPIFHALVLADEINRASPRTQSALLEAMEERRVTVAGTSHVLPRPFIVLATQNPVEQEGTYRLPEAQIDRFLMQINVQPPGAEVLEGIIEQTTSSNVPTIEARIDGAFLERASLLSRRVLVAPHVNEWISALVLGTAEGEVGRFTLAPCSPRAAIALRRTSQVAAMTAGRLAVSCADVRDVAANCLRHRMVPGPDGRGRGLTADDLVELLFESVPTPAQECLR